MALEIKPGTRLRSAVCTTEIAVVRADRPVADLRCGGAPMLPLGEKADGDGAPVPPFDAGTLVGKRYTDPEEGIEVLCTKAGAGSLSVGETPLAVKSAKPLPSSD